VVLFMAGSSSICVNRRSALAGSHVAGSGQQRERAGDQSACELNAQEAPDVQRRNRDAVHVRIVPSAR